MSNTPDYQDTYVKVLSFGQYGYHGQFYVISRLCDRTTIANCERKEDAARICQCLNACDGMPDPEELIQQMIEGIRYMGPCQDDCTCKFCVVYRRVASAG